MTFLPWRAALSDVGEDGDYIQEYYDDNMMNIGDGVICSTNYSTSLSVQNMSFEIHSWGSKCDDDYDADDVRDDDGDMMTQKCKATWTVHEHDLRNSFLQEDILEGSRIHFAINEARSLHAMGDVKRKMNDLVGAAGKCCDQ
jgi:hypothetical protein